MALKLFKLTLESSEHPSVQATAYSNLGNFEQRNAGKDLRAAADSERYFQKAIELDPNFVDAWYNLGTLYDALGRYDDAMSTYEQVLALSPTHQTAMLNLANSYFRKGELAQAVEIQQRMVNMGSDTMSVQAKVSALNNMGQVYRDAGDHASAQSSFLAAMQLDPLDSASLANLLQARRTLCYWEGLEEHHMMLVNATVNELKAIEAPDEPLVTLTYLAEEVNDNDGEEGRMKGGGIRRETVPV